MATSLALAREAKKRKRENIKNKLERMQSAKKQKLESAFETVQSNDNPNIRRIADLAHDHKRTAARLQSMLKYAVIAYRL